jgi:hypothetical protein
MPSQIILLHGKIFARVRDNVRPQAVKDRAPWQPLCSRGRFDDLEDDR